MDFAVIEERGKDHRNQLIGSILLRTIIVDQSLLIQLVAFGP